MGIVCDGCDYPMQITDIESRTQANGHMVEIFKCAHCGSKFSVVKTLINGPTRQTFVKNAVRPDVSLKKEDEHVGKT